MLGVLFALLLPTPALADPDDEIDLDDFEESDEPMPLPTGQLLIAASIVVRPISSRPPGSAPNRVMKAPLS